MPIDLTVLAALIETTPNTRANPALATDAYLVANYQVTPIQGDLLTRAIDKGYAGGNPAVLTKQIARHQFDIELSGAGTATGIPKWTNLLRACLFGQATAGASEVTVPLSSSGDGGSLSLDGWKENVRHRAFGGRGNAVFTLEEGGLPRIGFDFLAQIHGGTPADANTPGAVTLPTYPAPVEVNNSNTVVTLDSFTLGLKSITIDLGMQPGLYATTAQRTIVFDKSGDKDRRGITGTVVFELPDPSAKSFFGDISSQTPRAFSLVHGTAAGNIIDISSPGFVLRDISYQTERTRILASCSYAMVPTAANNELVLKTR